MDPRVDEYLREVGALLPGPAARRRRILDELRDGLNEAVAGLPSGQAADAAIEQFGRPQVVAAAFSGELAIAYARSVLLRLLATGPLIGACWLLATGPPRPLFVVVPVLPLVAAAVVLAARTVATTGSLVRWLPETGPAAALTATGVVAALAIVADVVVVSRYLVAWPPGALGVVAVLASAIRCLACCVVLRRVRTWSSV